jgi:hypothetical protein
MVMYNQASVRRIKIVKKPFSPRKPVRQTPSCRVSNVQPYSPKYCSTVSLLTCGLPSNCMILFYDAKRQTQNVSNPNAPLGKYIFLLEIGFKVV